MTPMLASPFHTLPSHPLWFVIVDHIGVDTINLLPQDASAPSMVDVPKRIPLKPLVCYLSLLEGAPP